MLRVSGKPATKYCRYLNSCSLENLVLWTLVRSKLKDAILSGVAQFYCLCQQHVLMIACNSFMT